jgi:glutamate N-acetyltransferase/amino-acid N-acetyltransferase
MAIRVPRGFKLAGVYSGIKRDPRKLDVTLIVSDGPAAAAGVYTTNRVFAAPVALDRSRTPSDRVRAVVANSGNANACTGGRGMKDAREMARLAADACGAEEDQVLVLSTGIIGEYMPMEKLARGIAAAAAQLAADQDALTAAARGILTTDTVHKLSGRTVTLGGREVQITGMAKGAGMVGPNMATILSVILTDAPLSPQTAQAVLTGAVEDTFNMISVDGHTSTNDTVLLLANGAAGGEPLAGRDLDAFAGALAEVSEELAKAIPADGEGATHVVTIEVSGCADRQSARRIARTVADSPLVKTAVTGNDPNWGRIVSAAGYAGVPFDPEGVSLRVNGFLLYEAGAPAEFDAAAVSASIHDNFDTLVELRFREGDAAARFWTSDLTVEYIRINADYHT